MEKVELKIWLGTENDYTKEYLFIDPSEVDEAKVNLDKDPKVLYYEFS